MPQLTNDQAQKYARQIIFINEKIARIKSIIHHAQIVNAQSLENNYTIYLALCNQVSLTLDKAKQLNPLPGALRERCREDRNALSHTDDENPDFARTAQDITPTCLWDEHLQPNTGLIWLVEQGVETALNNLTQVQTLVSTHQPNAPTGTPQTPTQITPEYYQIIENSQNSTKTLIDSLMAYTILMSSDGTALDMSELKEKFPPIMLQSEASLEHALDTLLEAEVYALSPSGQHLMIIKKEICESATQEFIENNDIEALISRMEALDGNQE